MPRIIAAAAAALVVYQWAVARPLWLDEEMIALNIRERGFVGLGGRLALGQSAPYGWLVLERLALLAFGQGERALRLCPLLFGLGTIATALWIGRRWLDTIASSALVLLCSISQWITYSFVEVKPYSADVCFGLLLPALAAWAVETDRVAVWWVVAALAQWVGNGALFVTPACGAAIVIVMRKRGGMKSAFWAAVPALLWVLLFAANYVFVLRPAQSSEFLQTYWQLRFPPTGAGPIAATRWLGARLIPFAEKPGGTGVGRLLWAAAAAGFVAARGRRRTLGLMYATVPLSGFALTVLRFVPFFERLVLWIVPALYVGVALLTDLRLKADTTYAHVVSGLSRTIGFAVVALVCANVTWRGLDDLRDRPRGTHHRLDDRDAVRWLTAHLEPGDVIVTTQLALPAIWWYGRAAAPLLEARYVDPGPECRPNAFARALDGASRVVVFFGFHFDDEPRWFDDLLLNELADVAPMTTYRGFDGLSRVAIFDRRLQSRHDPLSERFGCIVVRPASRW